MAIKMEYMSFVSLIIFFCNLYGTLWSFLVTFLFFYYFIKKKLMILVVLLREL